MVKKLMNVLMKSNIRHGLAALSIGYTLLFSTLAIAHHGDKFDHKSVIISESEPFLQGLQNAQGFLYTGAYKLHDHLLPNQQIAQALEEVARRSDLKSKTIVILESHLTPEEQKTGLESVKAGDSLEAYKKIGVQIDPSSPAFNATHYKILVTQRYAFVGTTNFDKDFEENGLITRDFSLVLPQPSLIQELKTVFENDLQHKESQLNDFNVADLKLSETQLSWGPNLHRKHLGQLIQIATESIEIYQQALQDEALTNLLVDAIKRGVKVSLLMSQYPFGFEKGNKSEQHQRMIIETVAPTPESKGEVRLTGKEIYEGPLKGKKLHIHAKVLIIDGGNPQKALMYLGSANFYTPALDKDRNVGAITRDQEYIKPVRDQFLLDWEAHKK
jgi:phosphatidylserine/phosphatidylglycerophosphate/cardiolipin synthase-like enzyme